MDKRFFLAMVLSLLVLMAYSAILPKKQPIVNQEVRENISDEALPSSQLEKPIEEPESAEQILPNIIPNNELYNVETQNFSYSFSNLGGFLVEVYDKISQTKIDIKNIGLVMEWKSYAFTVNELPRGFDFSYSANEGGEIRKIFRIKDDDSIELTISQNNLTSSIVSSYDISVGHFDSAKTKDPLSDRYKEAFCEIKGVVQRKAVHGLKKAYDYDGKISFLGLRDRYFCSVIAPQIIVNKGVVENINNTQIMVLNIEERKMAGGSSSVEDFYKIYIGPQDEQRLKEFFPGAEIVINYGFFDPISKVLLLVLKLSHKVLKNWGLSIIFMTILIYFIMFPLSLKSMISMKKLQALAPKIEELKAKYKDNPQKLQIETMELYKREKVNPFGGCLPMLLQIPVFFALYQVLMRFINLKGAHFLWIKDLSAPDRLFVFDNVFPVIGSEINILPLLMAGTMFLQQKLTSSAKGAPSTTADQQKMMAIIMPVLFGVLFYKMPSGLVLYWFMNSVLMVIFQWKIARA